MRAFTICLCLILFMSCKNQDSEKPVQPELSIAQKIAHAHGYEHWDKVEQIDFTFRVDRDQPGGFRSWQWQPKTNDITVMTASDTLSFNRADLDSISARYDRAFINDKFWLMIPFQLVWDEGITVSSPVKIISPVQKKQLNKITLLYSDDGGYTPGDAYDLFYNDEYLIEEWIFRRGNQPEPGLACTFESYEDFNGIKLATEHKKDGENWNLKLLGIKVKMNDQVVD
ncbi:MAG: hypothetical protein KJN59_05175 [Bacteroidia bacterium]|nr:hypothetical protein [Bacteroidia bacterium]